MKTKHFLAATLSALFLTVSAADKNPVVMTINGKDVRLSEFEYLYRKNKQQQIEEQPFDKYVDMFVTYKLKVADAVAEGIDTTKSFVREYNMYRNELLQSYLEDKTVNERLALEQYERMGEEVDVYHLMISLENGSTVSRTQQKAYLDSLRTLLVNGADWAAIADKHSIDPSAKRNHGHIGWIRSGMFPYPFEYQAWNTPEGEISEVFATDYGYHLVKPVAHRASKGEVLAEHILLLTPRDQNPEGVAAVKARVDSIYALIKNGADFEELAKQFSEDPGSKRNGGKLPWFGAGRMVPAFEKVAFETPIDSVSLPFATPYGFHIVKKLGARGLSPFVEVKDQIIAQFKNDERHTAARDAKLVQIKEATGFKYLPGRDEMFAQIKACGGFDSLCISRLDVCETPLFSFADKKVLVKDLMPRVRAMKGLTVVGAERFIEDNIDIYANELLIDYEMNRLEKENVDVANLANEYRDGLLLFAVSDKKVWRRSNEDAEGLQAFFEANRGKYTWDKPRFKGLLIQAANDSVSALINDRLATLGGDTIMSTIRKEFAGNVRIDKVILPQGKNSLIDVCAFGADKATAKPDSRYPVYFVYDWRIIEAPEVAADDKGAVVVDYQNQLESDWIAEMKAKYPVKINKKALKKVK